jgi:hypothetical protein
MWILLAGLSALSTSLVDLTKKQANGKEIDFAVINFYSFFFAFLPACLLVVAWGLPEIADNYWLVSTYLGRLPCSHTSGQGSQD